MNSDDEATNHTRSESCGLSGDRRPISRSRDSRTRPDRHRGRVRWNYKPLSGSRCPGQHRLGRTHAAGRYHPGSWRHALPTMRQQRASPYHDPRPVVRRVEQVPNPTSASSRLSTPRHSRRPVTPRSRTSTSATSSLTSTRTVRIQAHEPSGRASATSTSARTSPPASRQSPAVMQAWKDSASHNPQHDRSRTTSTSASATTPTRPAAATGLRSSRSISRNRRFRHLRDSHPMTAARLGAFFGLLIRGGLDDTMGCSRVTAGAGPWMHAIPPIGPRGSRME